ncbi:MAG TPA: TonB-dependent receptor [Povalibacter sp.]|nr:TonB-dependent receptor [Povalibacter sp.]
MRALEEVTVTAQRREENLQNVPISISAFTSASIEENMFADVSDYLVKTPNASFMSTGARSRREISIRGVTNFLPVDNALRTSTFGFYVDGFSVSGTSVNPPIMDVERIEVLRGPQATYFGRNAAGGGISITSNKPVNEFDASVSADYGRFNTVDLEGMLNVPIVDGKLAARFNAKYASSDGNIKNINPIGGGNDSTYKYYKGSLRFTPTDQLTIDLTASSVDEEVGMREGVPSGVFAPFEGDTLYADFPDLNGDGKADPDPDGVGFYPRNRSRVNFSTPQSIGTNFDYAIGTVHYQTQSLSFTSVTGYIDSDFYIAGDIDGGSHDFFNEYRHTPRKSFSQEFRLQNTGDQPLLWNVGLLYAKDKGTSDNRTYVGADGRFGLPNGFLIDSSDSTGSSQSWAVFGQLDWKVIDALTLSFGGRYSRENIEQTEIGFSGVTLTSVSADNTFTDFSPRFAIGYDLTGHSRLYGSVSKGFKSGGVQISPLPGAASYDPETLWNYEVGWKGDLFDARLRLNAAVFFMDWKDLQTSYQQSGTDEDGNLILFGGIVNADKAESKGVELTATLLPMNNLLINLSAGYLDAKYKKFTSYLEGENRVLDGQTIPNSPKWTLAADGEYRFDITASLEGFARAEWNYRSGIRSGNDALIHSGFPWEVPAYNSTNIRVGVRADKYTVTLYSENVFDQVYFLNSYSKAFTGGNFIEPSVQRYGVRVTYDFK